MLEFTLFVLLGIFYWAYARFKDKNEKRWIDLSDRLRRLDSQLRSGEARSAEIRSQLESLGVEVEKLRNRGASAKEQPPVPTPQPSPAHDASLSSPPSVGVTAGPLAPMRAGPSAPAEHGLPAGALPAPVPIPPAATVPALSGTSSVRLAQESHPSPLPPPAAPPAEAARPAVNKVQAPPSGGVLNLSQGMAAPAVSPPPHPATPPSFTVPPAPGRPMSDHLKRLLNLEELLGTNYLIKIGVVILVIGIGGFIFSNLDKIPTWLQLLSAFLLGVGMLISGTRYESGKYRLLARAAMGGGWAVIFITTWALHHAGKRPLLSSPAVDFVLLMIVATAMVLHTLRYNSQVVTGFAFLLPSLTVTVTLGFASGVSDAVRIPGLVGNAILALGLVMIVFRRRWFEMEVFGVVVTYLNHFFWIRPVIERGSAAERAASFYGSAVLLIAYWAIFRASYIVRKVDGKAQEAVSSVAALLNTFMLLSLLKYQAAHPELAFRCLLALGAVELILGQLPITRRRRTAFIILTTLGATFLAVALPFKFSGAPLSVLLLAEAEAFFLAGVFTREIVFRRLGMLTGLLVAIKLELLAFSQIGTPGFSGLTGANASKAAVVYGLATLVFYANSHWVARRWPDLIQTWFEGRSFLAFSYIAGNLAFVGIWLVCPALWLTVAWSGMALALALAGDRLKLNELGDQAHIVAGASFLAALSLNLLPLEPHHYTRLSLETVMPTALLLYACSRQLRLTNLPGGTRLSAVHTWTATLLLAMLAWYALRAEYAAPAWMGLALLLAIAGRTFKLKRFSFQAWMLALAASAATVGINLVAASPHTHDLVRLLTATIVAVLLYVCARWAALVEVEIAPEISALHTWAGTGIIAALAWYETPSDYSAPIWCGLALALVTLGNKLKRGSLEAQGHCLAVAGILSALFVNLHQATRGHFDVRLLVTLGICVACLYLCAYWRGVLTATQEMQIGKVYSWAASALVFLLLWYELQPVYVAVGWALFGVVLFELGIGRRSLSLRVQSYLALAGSFGRIFYVNINAAGHAGEISPRVWTLLSLAAVYFYVYARLTGRTDDFLDRDRKLEASSFACYFGGITVAALARAEFDPYWVVAAWAAMTVVLLALAWRLRRRIFLDQGLILCFAVFYRTVVFNFYQYQYPHLASEHTRFLYVGVAVALLFLAVPLSLRLRPGTTGDGLVSEGRLARLLAGLSRHPEQVTFFVAFALLTILLYLEIPNTVTLVWGAEALLIFLFALLAGVRSYRLAAIALLLVCVGRVVLVDLWRFEGNTRWLTGIGLGTALIAVGYLSIRYREAIRRYL